jgi:hypothetical protein
MIGGLVPRSSHRIASFVLLSGGVVMVFAGLTTALGFSTTGVIASAAAIAALLYAGGVWFGPSARADVSVVVFTPALTVAAGPYAGRSVADLYPLALRKVIDAHCRAAIEGRSQRFSPAAGRTFEAAPVRGADGAVVYGVLVADAATPERAAAAG